jgi:hypothetical protein
MTNTATVFLFSEVDEETGNVVGVQYPLSAYQFDKLLADIDNDKTLIQFGKVFHHSDDIIKIIFS